MAAEATRTDDAAMSAVWRRWAPYLLVPLGHFAGAKFGVLYTAMPEGTAILWPPNSVLLAALLLRQGRGAPALGLLVVAAEVAADLPAFSLTEALLFGLVNVAEAWIGFALLRRLGFDPGFGTLRDFNRFLLAAPLAAALCGAMAGAGVYSAFRGAQVGYLEFLRVWWFGDGLGLMVFTPLWLGLARAQAAWGGWRVRPWQDVAALVLAAAALLAFLVTQRAGSAAFGPELLLPFALWLAARFGVAVAAAAGAAMAMAMAVLVTQGGHPFGGLPAREAVLRTQGLVLLLALVPLGLAALLAQLRARQSELETLNARLNALNRELESRVLQRTAELDALNADLQRQVQLDPLTGLFNRRAFFAHAEQTGQGHERRAHPLGLLMIDLDHFKAVNDRLGHAAGDEVLVEVARRMERALRPQDVLARYGGEEFAVLLNGATLADAMRVAMRLRESVSEELLQVQGKSLAITISVGAASSDGGHATVHDLLRRADEALYDAKRQGRDRVVAAAQT